jgi:hypothetical protein
MSNLKSSINLILAVLLSMGTLIYATTANANHLETVQVTGVNSSAWSTVTLNHTYNEMVVVCSVVYANNSVPEVVRMQNATGNSFQIRLQNPSDEVLVGENVNCIITEVGIWLLPDFSIMTANKITSTVTDGHGISWDGEEEKYNFNFENNVAVMGQVMTYNDPSWSVFWDSGNWRKVPPRNSAITVGKHVGEDVNSTRADETLGVIFMEQGARVMDGVPYEVFLGDNKIKGIDDDPKSYDFVQTYNGDPAFAIVSQSGMNNGNGSWAVLRGSDAMTGGVLTIAVDEDQIGDTERSHGDEEVTYIIFESNIDELVFGLF